MHHPRNFRNPRGGAERCICGNVAVSIPGCVSDLTDAEALGLLLDLQRVLHRGRGALIVAEASASARVVESREALARTSPRLASDHERARVRLVQAEAEHVAARAALEAGGGR